MITNPSYIGDLWGDLSCVSEFVIWSLFKLLLLSLLIMNMLLWMIHIFICWGSYIARKMAKKIVPVADQRNNQLKPILPSSDSYVLRPVFLTQFSIRLVWFSIFPKSVDPAFKCVSSVQHIFHFNPIKNCACLKEDYPRATVFTGRV